MIDRFKIWKGYKFDKIIFRSLVIILLLAFSLEVFLVGGQNSFYYNCSEAAACSGEFFLEYCDDHNILNGIKYREVYSFVDSVGLCYSEDLKTFFPPGYSYGEPVSFWFQGLEGVFTGLLIFLTFIINHLFYNRRFKI